MWPHNWTKHRMNSFAIDSFISVYKPLWIPLNPILCNSWCNAYVPSNLSKCNEPNKFPRTILSSKIPNPTMYLSHELNSLHGLRKCVVTSLLVDPKNSNTDFPRSFTLYENSSTPFLFLSKQPFPSEKNNFQFAPKQQSTTLLTNTQRPWSMNCAKILLEFSRR